MPPDCNQIIAASDTIKRKGVIRSNEPLDSVPYGVSVIPQKRLDFLVQKCRETLKRNPGNILEVGVYKGGSLIKLAEVIKEICPNYKVYGIDTFSGHPYSDNHPVHPKGKYADTSLTKLREHIGFLKVEPYINLFKGKVEEIFDELILDNISFAHVDADLYIPIRFCAEHVPRRMNRHGLLYFDDYGHEHCPGATMAINEYFDKELINEIYMIDDNTCWSCYININEYHIKVN